MAGFAAAALILVAIAIRMRRVLGAMAGAAAGGLLTLGMVNLTGLITGVLLPLNLFSLLVCCFLGAPGVITLLLFQLFW